MFRSNGARSDISEISSPIGPASGNESDIVGQSVGDIQELMSAPPLLPAFPINEYIVATPIQGTDELGEVQFQDGITIRRLGRILWGRAIINRHMSDHEKESLQQTGYWLCTPGAADEDEAYRRSWLALVCTQIICPVGAQNLHLRFVVTQEGLDNIGSYHHDELYAPLMGRVTDLHDMELANQFDRLYGAARDAYRGGAVRIQNPLALLHQGLHIREPILSLLYWAMGLDMLMMAGGIRPFVSRLTHFLGANTLVFPRSSTLGQQPRYVVADAVEDIYDLRNAIAHGQETPRRYLEAFDFLDADGVAINVDPMTYGQHLSQCALFLLCKCLHKVFIEDLVNDTKEPKAWRRHICP
jgi:hypothetical protein